MTRAFTIVACILLLAPSLSAQAVKWQGFDGHSNSQSYTKDLLKKDFPGYSWHQGLDQYRTYLSGVRKNGKYSLKVTYPAYKSGANDSGAQFQWNLPSKHTDLKCEYQVRFSSGFQWKGGGKLPGLGGNGATVTGGTLANGYNGFSSRLMWRPNGKLVAYVYRVNRPGGTNYGEDFVFKKNGADFKAVPDRWYKIKMRVHLNDVGTSNGFVQAFVDGTQVLYKGNIEWRRTNNLKIDSFLFSTFPGGGANDSYWYPTKTQHAWFDNIYIFN